MTACIAALMRGATARNARPSPTQGLPETALDAPMTVEAEAPTLTPLQQECVAGYAQNPFFQDEAKLSDKTCKSGLWWFGEDGLVMPDHADLRQTVL